METISFKPIGIIRTPFRRPEDAPIQPSKSEHARGWIEISPEFVPGLANLDELTYITLIFNFHLSKGYKLSVIPANDTRPHGLFATRSPQRPNAIGISVVRILRIEGGTVHIEDVDMVDGTPLLDIKPFIPAGESTGD